MSKQDVTDKSKVYFSSQLVVSVALGNGEDMLEDKGPKAAVLQ